MTIIVILIIRSIIICVFGSITYFIPFYNFFFLIIFTLQALKISIRDAIICVYVSKTELLIIPITYLRVAFIYVQNEEGLYNHGYQYTFIFRYTLDKISMCNVIMCTYAQRVEVCRYTICLRGWPMIEASRTAPLTAT